MIPPSADVPAAPEFIRAGELFRTLRWNDCVQALEEADARQSLGGDALTLLGDAAYLTGRDEQAAAAYARAYQRFVEAGDLRAAARSAAGCTFVLVNAGEQVRAGGWAARARLLVDENALGGPEAGWVLADEAHRLIGQHRLDDALSTARAGESVGLAARDAEVVVLSRLTIGFALLLLLGERTPAIQVFDEIMVAVSSDETSPAVVGLSYCSAIGACMLLRDVARAREWTRALDRWCDARPDLVPYRGTCLVHRSQMLAFGGDWAGAVGEAVNAEALLRGPAAGEAAYQLGELHRLMGQHDEAAGHYRRANSLGKQPEPGLSRLRIAQGRADVAETTLRRLDDQARSPEDRAELLAALVEAQLCLDQVRDAERTAAQLRDIAGDLPSPLLHGLAEQAVGAVLLAAGDAGAALASLQRSRQLWLELDLPHPCAQVRSLIGRCLRALGDEASATMEFEAARECFVRLGALPDLADVDALLGRPVTAAGSGRAGDLTDREVQVIRLVAAGHTNRKIAGDLHLSEKTIARHLSNIYAKLDLPSRAAATAYAYEHGLI